MPQSFSLSGKHTTANISAPYVLAIPRPSLVLQIDLVLGYNTAMITSIEIENLRGIAHGRLDGLTELTVLIGPNGSGKSSVLDSIFILMNPNHTEAVKTIANRHSGTSNSLKWLVHKNDNTVKFNCVVDNIHIGFGFEYFINRNEIEPLLTVGDPVTIAIIQGKEPPPVDPIDRTVENLKKEIKMIGKYTGMKQIVIHDIFSELSISGRQYDAVEMIRNIVPGILDMKILTEAGVPYLFVSYANHSVPLAVTGDGIYALAQFGLELALRPGGIALIEEPEIHLHPAAIRQTAKMIWSAVRRGVQVILTTHSIELIDGLLEFANGEEELNKLSVFRTLLDDGQLKVSRISGENVEFARNQIGDDLR